MGKNASSSLFVNFEVVLFFANHFFAGRLVLQSSAVSQLE